MVTPPGTPTEAVAQAPPHEGQEFPVSFSQQARFDLNAKLEQAQIPIPSAMWCMVDPYRIRGSLDLDALETACGELLRRHSALAVSFRRDGCAWKQVVGSAQAFALEVDDLTSMPAAEREHAAALQVAELTQRPYDPARGPQLRVVALRLGSKEHVVVTAVDHLVFDVVSGIVTVEDLAMLYSSYARGRTPSPPQLVAQFPEFAAWQRGHFQGETLAAHLERVRSRLGAQDPIVPFRFPFARKGRPVEELAWRVGYETVSFTKETRGTIDELCRRLRISRFAVHVTALLILLSIVTDERDVRLRTPAANRVRPGTERSIGWYANAMIVGAHLSEGDRFSDVLQRVWKDFLAHFEDQELPFDLLLKHLQPDAYPQWGQIPTVALTFHDRMLDAHPEFAATEVSFDEEMFEEIDDYPVTTALLALRLEDMENHLRISARYRLDLYTEDGVASFLSAYRDIVTRVARDHVVPLAVLKTEFSTAGKA